MKRMNAIPRLLLSAVFGLSSGIFPAQPVLAAPALAGMNPSLTRQAASLLVESLSAGDTHNCAIKTDGTLVCWGTGTTDTNTSPEYGQSMPPSGTFTQLSAGANFTCGIKGNDTLVCWGYGGNGQSSPPAGTFTQVSAGSYHSCGLTSHGIAVCWGDDTYGQTTSTPVASFTQISAGGYHSCGLKNDGTLTCWGRDNYNQADPPTGTFRQVSSGFDHTCGIKSDGTLACWGLDENNQTDTPAGTFIQVSTGYQHSCAIASDGTLACWGDNSHAQAIPPSGTFVQVTAGYNHSCGLKSDGTVVCWGDDTYGQSAPPTAALFGRKQISAGGGFTCLVKDSGTLGCWGGLRLVPAGTFRQVSTGGAHACAVRSDGTVACWGAGTTNAGTTNEDEQGQSIPPSGTFIQVSAGYRHTCGVRSDGTLACWGAGTTNKGTGDEFGQSIPPGGIFTQVSAGVFHTCGLKSDGTIACWGEDVDGRADPPGGTFTQVGAGDISSCGLRNDGTIVCWGANYFGQTTPPAGIFTQISVGYTQNCGLKDDGSIVCWGDDPSGFSTPSTPPAGTFAQISAGVDHSCGLGSDGIIACWGNNSNGQLDPFTISGNAGVARAMLSYDNAGKLSIVTADGSGNYSLTVPSNWSGTVTVSRVGYTFAIDHIDYAGVLSDQTNQDYVPDQIVRRISGNVALTETTLNFNDGDPEKATSMNDGSYTLLVPNNWSGTVTPMKLGYTFTPASRNYSNVSGDQAGQDYTAAAITCTISGNAGVGGTTLNYSDGGARTVTADDHGNYSFTVPFLWAGTVTPSKPGYTFTPASRDYIKVMSDETNQNYAIVMTVGSQGANDGYILETSENSNQGGMLNSAASTFRLGDDASNRQYRAILSFKTAGLPDKAVITGITLQLKKNTIIGGGDPFAKFQGLMLDIKKGIFGTAASLQVSDFQALAGKSYGPFKPVPVNHWYVIDLTGAKGYINKMSTSSGLTQIRLRFKLDDNHNSIANYLSFFSGNAAPANRPQLIITYNVP